MVKHILIAGGGGLGREVCAMIRALPEWTVAGFYDDSIAKGTEIVTQVKCIGSIAELKKINTECCVVVALGDPIAKKRIIQDLSNNPLITFPSLIHPSVVIGDTRTVKIGDGVVVSANVSMTTNIVLEDHVFINLNSTIGHDSIIGRFSSIMPGVNISGDVTIEESVLVGSGAIILNGLTIGSCAVIGAGAVVTKSVQPGSRVIGIPARPY